MSDDSFFRNRTFKFILLIVILLICWQLGRFYELDIDQIRSILAEYPLVLSCIIFVLFYAVITFFVWFGPKDLFRVSSAILFGPYVSSVFVWLGEMVNLVVLFSLSRKLGRGFVEEKFKLKSRDFEKVKSDSGFIGVLAIRLNPLIPFRLMDLAFGLSSIDFRKYFLVSLFATFPRILWLQYILAKAGRQILNPVQLIKFLQENKYIVLYSALYFLVIIVLSIAALIVKWMRARKKN